MLAGRVWRHLMKNTIKLYSLHKTIKKNANKTRVKYSVHSRYDVTHAEFKTLQHNKAKAT